MRKVWDRALTEATRQTSVAVPVPSDSCVSMLPVCRGVGQGLTRASSATRSSRASLSPYLPVLIARSVSRSLR